MSATRKLPDEKNKNYTATVNEKFTSKIVRPELKVKTSNETAINSLNQTGLKS